jgi:hypothetical protein
MLINLDNIANIVSRSGPTDSKFEFEVGVFLENKFTPTPDSQSPVWTGTYEVIFRGSAHECSTYLRRIHDKIPESYSIDLDQ